MTTTILTEADLRRELDEFKERYPKLADDELFVLWFLRAFVADDEGSAAAALCGGPRDKGVDAVLIDDPARIVFLVQGKYRHKVAAKAEHRGDVMGFAQIAVDLCGNGTAFSSLSKDLSPDVSRRLDEARARIKKRGYALHHYYVTLGTCSGALRDEGARIVRAAEGATTFEIFDGKRILLLLADYLDGVAPPVPSLDLEIESGGGVRTGGVFNRYDSKTDIESWVFSMTREAVEDMYERAGSRLFARNVRGFLGSTEINRGMETTLQKEPDYFWYYNNGITIVCDDAKQESSRGRQILRVTNPQIINGQQTTRTLARRSSGRRGASVLVRVIRVPRSPNQTGNGFEMLVSRIVSATNWQNAIRPSDLMSNDRRQIEIERQLRKLHYLYLRKRMTKSEARRATGGRHLRLIKKEEIAQAVAACDLDPFIVREGKEGLFEERWYGQVFPSADPNAGNAKVQHHLDEMFGNGEWRTQAFLKESGWKREQGFLVYFMSKINARYKLPFRIRFDVEDEMARSRTKYYLIHASNHPKAALLMKEVMWPLGDEEGLFDFSGEKHGMLFSSSPREEELRRALLQEYSGKEVEFDQLREETWDLPFIEKHYRSVVKQLKEEGHVKITPVTSKTDRGLQKNDRVRFLPPKEGGGR